MSCDCDPVFPNDCNPCACTPSDPNNEPLASALQNFISILFGSVTKTYVDGHIVWTLPCNLDGSCPNFPRLSGEALACYFMRFICSQVKGITDNIVRVKSVSYNSTTGELTYVSRVDHYVDGLLMSYDADVTTVITTFVNCPEGGLE